MQIPEPSAILTVRISEGNLDTCEFNSQSNDSYLYYNWKLAMVAELVQEIEPRRGGVVGEEACF